MKATLYIYILRTETRYVVEPLSSTHWPRAPGGSSAEEGESAKSFRLFVFVNFQKDDHMSNYRSKHSASRQNSHPDTSLHNRTVQQLYSGARWWGASEHGRK